MIINFSVQNFHCIKDKITLSFEATSSKELEEYYVVEPKPGLRLLKLGLIYGANASGKTTVLKALDFLKEMVLKPHLNKLEEFKYTPFLFDEKTPYESSYFELEFIHHETKYLLEIEFGKEAILNEKLYFYQPNKALVYKRKTDISLQSTSIQFGSKIKFNREHKAVLEANTLWNNTVLGGYLKTNFTSPEMSKVIDWFEHTLESSIDPEVNLRDWVSDKLYEHKIAKHYILTMLQQADFDIDDIVIKKPNDKSLVDIYDVYFKHNLKDNDSTYVLSYEDESKGTQRYFQLGGLLSAMLTKEKIQPIDEIAASLHPDLVKHFLLTFITNARKSQLIITTHFRELLMEKDIFREDVIWFIDKQKDSNRDLYAMSDFNSSVIRKTSSIYHAYKIGKLGAKPLTGDYYIEIQEDVEA